MVWFNSSASDSGKEVFARLNFGRGCCVLVVEGGVSDVV